MAMQIKTMTRVTVKVMQRTRMTKAAMTIPIAMAPTLTRLLVVLEMPPPSDSVAACRYKYHTVPTGSGLHSNA